MRKGVRDAMILFLLVAALLAVAVVPLALVQPFKPQTPRGLQIAFFIKRWALLGSPILAALALLNGVRLWRGASGWWKRPALVMLLALALFAAWLSVQNPYEWMFHPLPGPGFAAAGDAGFVQDGDMVLAVDMQGESAAYPVRQMAYHHLVQDLVGGVPLVATY